MLKRTRIATQAPPADVLFKAIEGALAHAPHSALTPLVLALNHFKNDPNYMRHAHDPFVERLLAAVATGCRDVKFPGQNAPPIPGDAYERTQTPGGSASPRPGGSGETRPGGSEAPRPGAGEAQAKPPAPTIPEPPKPPGPKKPGE